MRASRWSIEIALIAAPISADLVLFTISSSDCNVTCYHPQAESQEELSSQRSLSIQGITDQGQVEAGNAMRSGDSPLHLQPWDHTGSRKEPERVRPRYHPCVAHRRS